MPRLEHRKWFQAVTGLASLLLAVACLLTVLTTLSPDAESAKLALFLMFIGALSGFTRLLEKFLPLVLLKLWPQLETDRSSQS